MVSSATQPEDEHLPRLVPPSECASKLHSERPRPGNGQSNVSTQVSPRSMARLHRKSAITFFSLRCHTTGLCQLLGGCHPASNNRAKLLTVVSIVGRTTSQDKAMSPETTACNGLQSTTNVKQPPHRSHGYSTGTPSAACSTGQARICTRCFFEGCSHGADLGLSGTLGGLGFTKHHVWQTLSKKASRWPIHSAWHDDLSSMLRQSSPKASTKTSSHSARGPRCACTALSATRAWYDRPFNPSRHMRSRWRRAQRRWFTYPGHSVFRSRHACLNTCASTR